MHRKASFNPTRGKKTSRRAKQAALGTAAAALYLGAPAAPAEAVVIYNGTSFSVISSNPVVEWDIDGAGGSEFRIGRVTNATTFYTQYYRYGYINSIGRNGRGFVRSVGDSTSEFRNLPAGMQIGPTLASGYAFGATSTSRTASWASTNFFYSSTYSGFSAAVGFTPGDPGYVGFKFDDGDTHYGWARITFNPQFGITVHEWAYEDTPDAPVLVGSLESVGGLAGDYNNDGKVSAADFTVWRDNIGALTLTNRDPDATGPVDADDFEFWKEQYGVGDFGSGAGSVAASIPEPTTGMLSGLALLACGAAGVRRWRNERRTTAEAQPAG